MAENVVVETEHKRVRFIRYDSGETLFIVKGANRKRSYMTGDNPTVKKLLASACEGEKMPIKAGIIRKLTTDDVKSFVSDNPDLSFGFWALVRLLEQYGNNNTQAEILRLVSYLLTNSNKSKEGYRIMKPGKKEISHQIQYQNFNVKQKESF